MTLPSRLTAFAVLFAPALLTSACSLDTDKFNFADGSLEAAGAAGVAGSSSVDVGGTGGTAGAGDAGAGGSEPGGAAGTDAAGAGGDAGEGGTAGAGQSGASGSAGEAGSAGSSTGIPCTDNFAGSQRCGANDTVEECDGTDWVPEPVTCANGCTTKGVDAFCKVCEPSSVRCTDALLEICKADGSGYDPTTATTCGDAVPTCNEAVGKCTQCKTGDKICINGFATACTAEGVFPLNGGQDCNGVARCVDGACLAEQCKLGETQCAGQQVQSCKADLTGFTDPADCPTGSSCVDGKGCVECSDPDGTQFCDGDVATTCTNGKKTVNAACGAGECVVANNIATCSKCVDGTVICAGQSLQECKQNAYVEVQACPTGTSCNAEVKACAECGPKDVRCTNTGDLQTCGGDGKYQLEKACGKSNLCDAANQRCLECAPGTTQCTKEGLLQSCNLDGKWATKRDCLTVPLCDAGGNACLDPTCAAGETRCGAGRQPQICNKTLNGWENAGVACAEACMDFPGDTQHGCVDLQGITAGADATCVVVGKTDRRLACWGAVAGAAPSPTPQFVPDARFVSQVALGADFACAIYDGLVHCWGLNPRGQLGPSIALNAASPTPVTVGLPNKETPITVVATGQTACALSSKNNTYCWGAGLGGNNDQAKPTLVPVVEPFVELTAHGGTVCGISATKNGYCWGNGNRGKLGDAQAGAADTKQPGKPISALNTKLQPVALTPIFSLSEGGAHGCAVVRLKSTDPGGQAFCWGANGVGQLGRGTTDTGGHPTAGPLAGSTAFLEVVSGDSHTCGLTVESGLVCWGAGSHGENGQTDGNVSVPAKVSMSATVAEDSLTAGGSHTCVNTKGGMFCWGDNGVGQLGPGAKTASYSASAIAVEMP
jgi:hypothetical protein